MHDHRKREKRPSPTEEELAAETATREENWKLYRAVFARRKAKEMTPAALQQSEELLLKVPELYTVFAYRREIIKSIGAAAVATETGAGGDGEWVPYVQLLLQELRLDSRLLLANYKNYAAFSHRHWIFNELARTAAKELKAKEAFPTAMVASSDATMESASPPPPSSLPSSSSLSPAASTTYAALHEIIQKERQQCEKLLSLDERNFHAWNYRRWVLVHERQLQQLLVERPKQSTAAPRSEGEEETSTGLAALATAAPLSVFSAEEAVELTYTSQKIYSNFSNYSAWHQRSLAIAAAARRWHAEWTVVVSQGTAAAEETDRHHAKGQQLLTQLAEEVDMLIKAIYCDPNDQAAWLYAPFVLAILHRRDIELHPKGAADVPARAVMNAFVIAVVDLIVEEQRFSGQSDCYLPFFFLATLLLTLHRDATQTLDAPYANRSGEKLQYYTKLCMDKLSIEEEEEADGARDTSLQRCIAFFHQRLVAADPMRKGMYDTLLTNIPAAEGE